MPLRARMLHCPSDSTHVLHAVCTIPCVPQAHAKQLKDAVQRVGSKSPLADFLSMLAAWASPCNWWSKETSQALLQLLLDSAAGSPGGKTPGAWQQLSSQEKDQLLPACYSWAVALGKVRVGCGGSYVAGSPPPSAAPLTYLWTLRRGG